MSGSFDLDDLIDRVHALKRTNAPGESGRPAYDRALFDTTFLLGLTEIDPDQEGVVRYVGDGAAPDARRRYAPSMVALQLYLESDTIAASESVYKPLQIIPAGDQTAARTEAIEALVKATRANDLKFAPVLGWAERIAFQDDYPQVYDVLRHRVLVARQTRHKVVLTRAVERAALDAVLLGPRVRERIAELEAACANAFSSTDANAGQQIDLAIDAIIEFVGSTLLQRFMDEAVNAGKRLANTQT